MAVTAAACGWARGFGASEPPGDVCPVVEDRENHRRCRAAISEPVSAGMDPGIARRGKRGIRPRRRKAFARFRSDPLPRESPSSGSHSPQTAQAACNAAGARGYAPVRSAPELRGGWFIRALRAQIGRVLGLPLRQEPIEVCALPSFRLGSASSQHGADFVQRERPVRIVRVHERHDQTIGVPRVCCQLF
jgi:hypothetical protein